jgi:hypothetical protein
MPRISDFGQRARIAVMFGNSGLDSADAQKVLAASVKRHRVRRRCRCAKEIPRIRVKSRAIGANGRGCNALHSSLGGSRDQRSSIRHRQRHYHRDIAVCLMNWAYEATASAWRVSLAPMVLVALSCGLPRCDRRCRRRARKLRVRNISQMWSGRRPESARRRSLFGRPGDEDAIVDSSTRLSMVRPNGTVRSVGWPGSWRGE